MSQPAEPAGFKAFLRKFTGLRSAPRELWIIFIAYIFENLAYKVGAAGVLTVWLSSDLGFKDVGAGTMVAIWSAIMTLITVLVVCSLVSTRPALVAGALDLVEADELDIRAVVAA